MVRTPPAEFLADATGYFYYLFHIVLDISLLILSVGVKKIVFYKDTSVDNLARWVFAISLGTSLLWMMIIRLLHKGLRADFGVKSPSSMFDHNARVAEHGIVTAHKRFLWSVRLSVACFVFLSPMIMWGGVDESVWLYILAAVTVALVLSDTVCFVGHALADRLRSGVARTN